MDISFPRWVIAKLTNIKRIIKEQMPADVQKWIDTLLYPLNNAISQITYALANQLTISDNFLGSVKTQQVTTKSFPLTFKHGLSVKPGILFIGYIADTSSNPAIFTTAPFAQWHIPTDTTSVVIDTITGLDATKTYNVTFVILSN